MDSFHETVAPYVVPSSFIGHSSLLVPEFFGINVHRLVVGSGRVRRELKLIVLPGVAQRASSLYV